MTSLTSRGVSHWAAERVWQDALAAGVRADIVYAGLAECSDTRGRFGLARRYRANLTDVGLTHHRPATRHNYNRLKDTVLGRGLRLVAVQYPMRSLAPLRKLLAPATGVLFVDNEACFRAARVKHGYDALFTDHYGGDFGHATRLGNRILAENVAATVLAACR